MYLYMMKYLARDKWEDNYNIFYFYFWYIHILNCKTFA